MTGTGLNNNLPYNDAYKLTEEEPTWESHLATTIPLTQQTLLEAWIRKHDGGINEPVNTQAYYRNSIHRLGQTFTTRHESVRNSHIAYSLGSSEWSAASITSILSHTRTRIDGSKKTQTFVIVKNYKFATDCIEDAAFRRYPEVGGRVVSNVLEDSAVLLSMDQVDSHIVTCSFDTGSGADAEIENFMICLPLDKVCYPVSLPLHLFTHLPLSICQCHISLD